MDACKQFEPWCHECYMERRGNCLCEYHYGDCRQAMKDQSACKHCGRPVEEHAIEDE